MAFTFLAEDGTALPEATSYVSVEEANDILAINIHAAAKWDALEDDAKEKLLSWASQYLDNNTRWYGRRVSAVSGLRWPRADVVDRDGTRLADDSIPYQLKVATASMATYLIDQDRSVERDQDSLVRLKADVVELEFQEGYRLPRVPAYMHELIDGLGSIKSSSRIRFGRIVK